MDKWNSMWRRIVSRVLWLAGPLVSFACFQAFSQTDFTLNTNWWLHQKDFYWSAETNGFETGLWWMPNTREKEFDIWVLSSTNAGLFYVRPPGQTPDEFELRDAHGVIVEPIKGKIDRALPKRISAKDLPQYQPQSWLSPGSHRDNQSYNYILLGGRGDPPNVLNAFSISDLYQIKQAGDYVLTVHPFMYKFEPNFDYVDRIDLPAVSIKIYLPLN